MYLYCIEEGQGSNLIIIKFEFFNIIRFFFLKILIKFKIIQFVLKPLRYYVNLNDVAGNMFSI